MNYNNCLHFRTCLTCSEPLCNDRICPVYQNKMAEINTKKLFKTLDDIDKQLIKEKE